MGETISCSIRLIPWGLLKPATSSFWAIHTLSTPAAVSEEGTNLEEERTKVCGNIGASNFRIDSYPLQ